MCPFLVWCLGQDVEFDYIGSWSLPFYILSKLTSKYIKTPVRLIIFKNDHLICDGYKLKNYSVHVFFRSYLFLLTFQCSTRKRHATSWSIKYHGGIQIWAAWQNQQVTCAPREASDQPENLPSLIRSSLYAQWIAKALRFLHTDSENWSDWADDKADLSHRSLWAHRSLCWFCHTAAPVSCDILTS